MTEFSDFSSGKENKNKPLTNVLSFVSAMYREWDRHLRPLGNYPSVIAESAESVCI